MVRKTCGPTRVAGHWPPLASWGEREKLLGVTTSRGVAVTAGPREKDEARRPCESKRREHHVDKGFDAR